MGIDVREIWNFDDPVESEQKFREALQTRDFTPNEQLEIWAQIARTFSLRRDRVNCHAILNEHWENAMTAGGRPKACFELEKGRGFRSGGEGLAAVPFFEAAAQSEVDDLRIDAIHMLAIDAEPDEATRLNLVALEQARSSSHPWAQRWQGTLCNNLGWTAFDQGRYDEAIVRFQDALAEREKHGNAGAIRIAKWCLARAYRAKGDLDEAFAMQKALKDAGGDGFVDEELGEILLEKGDAEGAKPYFRAAADKLEGQLGADSERIKRMRSLS